MSPLAYGPKPRRHSRIGVLALVAVAVVASLVPVDSARARRLTGQDEALNLTATDAFSLKRTDGAFVHFKRGTIDQAGVLRAHGLRPVVVLGSVDVVFAEGSERAFAEISRDERVIRLEANQRLPLLNNSATVATRVQEARALAERSGGVVPDGAGVGVAVIDTGILGSHPDLSTRIGKNYKIVCDCPFVEMDNTDTSSGHGTHVAGIVAGTGAQSKGEFAGVAPGATLYGFGAGDTLYILHAAVAFDYIVQHYDEYDPRIRVVTNSYGKPGTFDPTSVITRLTGELVDRGTSVVWAAGNSGGNGSADRMVDNAKNPTPGVISVGNYDDLNAGTRDGNVYSSSSRGLKGDAESYPDVVAPGTHITSTCIQELQPVCNLGFGVTTRYHPWYSTIQGTSMAAPHIAGIAALLYQADPTLTPEKVEDLLQDSAYKFGDVDSYEPDPQNPGGTVAFDKGAGLADAVSALALLRDPPPPPQSRKKKRERRPRFSFASESAG